MPSDVLIMMASSGRSIHTRRGDGRQTQRVGHRHAQRAQEREAADQDKDVHGVSARWGAHSVERALMDSGEGSLKKRCVHSRSMTNSSVIAPPMGIGR